MTAPTELRGLGYLPPGANVAFAVQPRPFLAHARTSQEADALLAMNGLPPVVIDTLDRAQIRPYLIDHIVGGAYVPDTDLGEMRLSVAVVFRDSVNEEAFLARLLTRRVVKGGKTWYEVGVGGVPMKLAKAAEKVWVFGWAERDLDAALGNAPPARLTDAMAGTISQKVPPDAVVWLATDSARWAEKETVKLLVGQFGKKEWLPALAKGRAVVAGLTLGDTPRLRLFVQPADADTRERLRAYFRKKATADGSSVDVVGEWVSLDTPTDPEAGFTTLKTFLNDAAK